MQVLDKDAFLAADDLDLVPVPLPAKYGADVGFYVRLLTGAERGQIEKRFAASDPANDPGGFRAVLLVRTIADASGKPIFTDDDAPRLMGKAAGVLETLFEAACRLNGFLKKDVEELEKN